MCHWCFSFLCRRKSGHWFIYNIIVKNGSARFEWVSYFFSCLTISLVFLGFGWMLNFIFQTVVTRLLKLFECRWKCNEDCMNSWRLVICLDFWLALDFLNTVRLIIDMYMLANKVKFSRATCWYWKFQWPLKGVLFPCSIWLLFAVQEIFVCDFSTY